MNNRIQNEIKHSNYLCDKIVGEVWNWESPAGKIRWKRRVDMLTRHLQPGKKVLEIGCGAGYFTKEIIKKAVDLTAIDISPDMIKEAKKNIGTKHRIDFRVENAFATTFTDKLFDFVIGSSVLHHLDIDLALSEIFRILKPSGSIFFTEPNMLNPQIFLERNVPFIRRITNNSPDETAFFLWPIRKKLKKQGFTNISVKSFDFLHPKIPQSLISTLKPLCTVAESVPLLQNIAGSLYICAKKT